MGCTGASNIAAVVHRVHIFNRPTNEYDGQTRLNGFTVYVGDSETPKTNPVCFSQDPYDSFGEPAVVVVTCDAPTVGRYVYVLLQGNSRVLNLREVQVFGAGAAVCGAVALCVTAPRRKTRCDGA